MTDAIAAARERSGAAGNRTEIALLCGCFCCLHTFAATEVIDWIDDGDTPVCPDCGAAAVLEGVTDLAELWRLREQRFGGVQPRGASPSDRGKS